MKIYPENKLKGSIIAGYYRPPEAGMPTILWSHGNAQNLASLTFTMDGLHQMGFGVMAYDYPGYGESSGEPSEEGCYVAVRMAYDFLLEKETMPEQIVLIGQSVGTGPTCHLASEVPNGGVILISPFLSAFRVMTKIPLFPGDRFNNLTRIREFDTPLLIIHGQNDQVIPQWHGQRLYEESKSESKTFVSVENAGHNDLFMKESIRLTEAIREFVAQFRKSGNGKARKR